MGRSRIDRYADIHRAGPKQVLKRSESRLILVPSESDGRVPMTMDLYNADHRRSTPLS